MQDITWITKNHSDLVYDFFQMRVVPPGTGDAKSPVDIALQKTLTEQLQKKLVGYTIVGEEVIPGYLHQFPDNITPGQPIAATDITDGTANFLKKVEPDFGTTVGVQHGRTPVFGVVCTISVLLQRLVGALRLTITSNADGQVIVNGKPVGASKTYVPGKEKMSFGLGKNRPPTELATLQSNVLGIDPNALRPGCASISFALVLLGKLDCYVSWKEKWTNIVPIYYLAKQAGLYINIDPDTLDLNAPFCLIISTVEFEENYLRGSELAKLLEN
jgi:fructose-1,6-bisphosphatase/inositol monophosphatase family enzyme